jgi:hypothetical protein
MYVVSIDPGETNFSWCALRDGNVVKWNLQVCDSSTGTGFLASLDKDFESHVAACDQVLIEQQPPRNYRMLRQMFYLEVYCASLNPRTCIVHASIKQPVWKVTLPNFKAPKDYRGRKRMSIECVEYMIEHGMVDVSMSGCPFDDTVSKRDDLADCLVQAIAYTRVP